jgi:predicted  nucleic acid-binding Zn-ribbon protein
VKASPEKQNKLLRLQALDTRAQQLEHTLKNLPQNAELAALQPSIDAVRAEHIDKLGTVEDARAELRRAESDVAVVEARMKRDEERVQQTASTKDVAALEGELESLRRRRADLEDIELNVMERLESLEAELAELEKRKDELTASVDELEEQRATARGLVENERSAVLADRATIAAAIDDAELIALYDKQRQRYGIGAALLVGGVSQGSNVRLSPTDLDEVRRAAPDDVVLCPDSGCILIRNEHSGL